MDYKFILKSTHVYTEQIYSGFAHSCKRRKPRDTRILEPPPPPPEHHSPSATPASDSPAAPPYIRRNRSRVYSSRCSITSNPGPPSGSPDSPMSLGSRTCTRTPPAVCSTLTVQIKQKLGWRKKVKDWDWDWDRFCVVLWESLGFRILLFGMKTWWDSLKGAFLVGGILYVFVLISISIWEIRWKVLRLHPKVGVSVSGSFHVHFRDSMKASSRSSLSWEFCALEINAS